MIDSLFDFSFSRFVTAKLIRILYGLAIIASAVGGLVVATGTMANLGGVLGLIGGLFVGVVVFSVALVLSRIGLEMTIVLFRIAENTGEMAANARQIAERAAQNVAT